MAEIEEDEPTDAKNEENEEKGSESTEEDQLDAVYPKNCYAILEDVELSMLGEDDSEIARQISFLPQEYEEQQTFLRDVYKQNEEIAVKLANMKLNNQQPEPIVDLDNVADSYKNNSDTEKNMLKIVEKFIWNFKQAHPARVEPFMVAYNECGVQKVLPTYILPVELPFFELYQWQACAEFVADYLQYDVFELPVRSPFMVYSPGYSVNHQNGNSLDMSMILCSILLARGYDTYVVHGYATKEVCEMDEREKVYEKGENEDEEKEHDHCVVAYTPMRLKLLHRKEKQSVSEGHKDSAEMEADVMQKYQVKYGPRPPRQLFSKFREAMQQKKESHVTKAMTVIENVPFDVLAGRRVHFWVLLRSKDINDPSYFYIESSTAERIEMDDPNYQYIESVWNNHNFWVNLQDHQAKKENDYFKLGEKNRWMSLLTTDEGTIMDVAFNEEQYMPSSWTVSITLSREDISRRYPNGKKVRYFKNLKYQMYAPFSMSDGLVSKITFYSDEEYKLPVEVIEHYFNRNDHLIKQRIYPSRNIIHEYFSPYRLDGLKEHIHNISDINSWEDERTICFRSSARTDGLSKINRSKNVLTEAYEGRDDKLFQKITTISAVAKEMINLEKVHHVISSIEENYLRNPNIHCDSDIKTRVFDIKNKRYFVKFHTGEDRIAYSYLELQKPTEKVKGHGFELTSDMWREYQVDDEAPPRNRIEVYRFAAKLVEDETKAITELQNTQKIITDILHTRLKERIQLELEPSIHDAHKNEYVKKKERASEEIDDEEKEEIQKQKKLEEEMKWDYLAPYILELGCPAVLTKAEAQNVFQSCMLEYKNHLYRRRDKLQSDLKKERETLSEKTEWFKRFQSSLLKEQEEEHHEFVIKSQLRIEVLEERLKKWHTKTPKFLQDLKEQLKNDYRLAEHVN